MEQDRQRAVLVAGGAAVGVAGVLLWQYLTAPSYRRSSTQPSSSHFSQRSAPVPGWSKYFYLDDPKGNLCRTRTHISNVSSSTSFLSQRLLLWPSSLGQVAGSGKRSLSSWPQRTGTVYTLC